MKNSNNSVKLFKTENFEERNRKDSLEKQKLRTKNLTMGALIGALYIILTLIAQTFGLASGVIQIRISEALCILPLFTGAAVPGLAVGCFIANIMTGCAIWDVIFGTAATLLGAAGAFIIGRKYSQTKAIVKLASLCPVISNVLIVPYILQIVYGAEGSLLYFAFTVGIGEIISCTILGNFLYYGLKGKVRW